jgi:hypothetical protein
LCTKTTKNAFNNQKTWSKTPTKPQFWSTKQKNNVYHIVDKVQNSYENTLIFDLIDNVVYVVLLCTPEF